jgi:hypothetical protein
MHFINRPFKRSSPCGKGLGGEIGDLINRVMLSRPDLPYQEEGMQGHYIMEPRQRVIHIIPFSLLTSEEK